MHRDSSQLFFILRSTNQLNPAKEYQNQRNLKYLNIVIKIIPHSHWSQPYFAVHSVSFGFSEIVGVYRHTESMPYPTSATWRRFGKANLQATTSQSGVASFSTFSSNVSICSNIEIEQISGYNISKNLPSPIWRGT